MQSDTVEPVKHQKSTNRDIIEIIDQLIYTIDARKRPLEMVTAIINATMYRGSIDSFKTLIRTRGYVGFERRHHGQ